MLNRREFGAAFAASAWVARATAARAAQSEWVPERPIRIVIPFAAGGGSDVIVRPVAQALSDRLKVPVVVDNKPGASGYIGAQYVKSAPADGYTLLMAYDGSIVVAPNIVKAPFDSVSDFAAVTKLCDANLIVVVSPKLGANTIGELVRLSKTREGGLDFGSAGVGTTTHLAGELLAARSGMRLKHVPYKGGGQSLADVISGQLAVQFTTIPTVASFVREGRLKAVAMTGDRRSPSMPDVPTVAESVPGYSVWSWYGLLAPARTPQAVTDRLQRELTAVLALPEIRDRYAAGGFEPVGSSSQDFGTQIKTDLALWGKVVHEAGIKAE